MSFYGTQTSQNTKNTREKREKTFTIELSKSIYQICFNFIRLSDFRFLPAFRFRFEKSLKR